VATNSRRLMPSLWLIDSSTSREFWDGPVAEGKRFRVSRNGWCLRGITAHW
jgi:hypothetical protein